MVKLGLKIVLIALSLLYLSLGLDNGLGLTPQMGWNSWNKFGCNINEALIKKTADLLVSTGLADKGYKYVNLDDCWQIARDQTTKSIIQDKQKFPSGMKSLADYVHSKGLKFGLYSDAGEKTCEGRPGSYGYEKIDANTYASWGVDYLKYDNCYNLKIGAKLRYFSMYKALNQSGRHIFYSMCNWGQERPWEWAGPLANSWRTTGDISDSWKSFTSILDQQVGLEVFAGKGGWNDPDMLQVGNGGMSNDEYNAHFVLWAILKAPLLIGCSLQNISQETLKILGNEEVIAINQDSLGIQASRIRRDVKTEGTFEVWGGELSNNRYVVVFFNRGELDSVIEVDIRNQLNIPFDSYSVRDVIRHTDMGIKTSKILSANVKRHSVEVLVLKIYKSTQNGSNNIKVITQNAQISQTTPKQDKPQLTAEQNQPQKSTQTKTSTTQQKPIKKRKGTNKKVNKSKMDKIEKIVQNGQNVKNEMNEQKIQIKEVPIKIIQVEKQPGLQREIQ